VARENKLHQKVLDRLLEPKGTFLFSIQAV
jgi:hypothetical protein